MTLWTLTGLGISVVLTALLVWALFIIRRSPFRALGVLVAGMAFHNFAIMILLSLGTPNWIVRVIQFWKEAVLIMLVLLALSLAYAWFRSGQRLRLTIPDYVAIAFALTALIYLFLPGDFMPEAGTLTQRIVSLRLTLLLPLLYAFGRIFKPAGSADLRWVTGAILGAAALVGIFGLFELWFVPTTAWFDWGVNLFSGWLGYQYVGPGGLPENFFQTTGSGLLLRRMVSTYISPLGIAYTGLLLVPLSVMALGAREYRTTSGWLWWGAFSLLIAGILFSMTRGALLSFVVELALLCVLLRTRRVVAILIAVTLLVGFMLVEYVNFGPLLTRDLQHVRPPAGYLFVLGQADDDVPPTPGSNTKSGELIESTMSADDPSARGHLAALAHGLDYLGKHPFGTGLGSAVPRYGTMQGPGESALLTIFGELGIVGGLLYGMMYLLAIIYGFRAFLKVRDAPLLAGLALAAGVGGIALLPIMITSNIWGNFSMTFLFWWCAGLSVTLTHSKGSGTPQSEELPDGKNMLLQVWS